MDHKKKKRRRRRANPKTDANLTVKEVAARFGLHANTVYGWIKDKTLPAYWFGRWRIAESDIQAFLQKRRNQKGGEEED